MPAAGGTRGYDGAKKTADRKRHIAVNTDDGLLMVHLTTADLSDGAGAQAILDALRKACSKVEAALRIFRERRQNARQGLRDGTASRRVQGCVAEASIQQETGAGRSHG